MYLLLCQLDRLWQKLLLCTFAFWHFSVVKGLHDGIILVVSLLVLIVKDQVASFEEQIVDSLLYYDMTIVVQRYNTY